MIFLLLSRAAGALAGLVLVLASAQAQPTAPAGRADAPLYQAFGGKAGLRALMDDFVARLKTDARIGPFFKDTSARHLAEQLTDQLCVQAGGPCVYEGETMKKSHAELGITKADFNRLVELLQDSMDARSVPFAAQNQLLARLAPMHRDIIGGAGP